MLFVLSKGMQKKIVYIIMGFTKNLGVLLVHCMTYYVHFTLVLQHTTHITQWYLH